MHDVANTNTCLPCRRHRRAAGCAWCRPRRVQGRCAAECPQAPLEGCPRSTYKHLYVDFVCIAFITRAALYWSCTGSWAASVASLHGTWQQAGACTGLLHGVACGITCINTHHRFFYPVGVLNVLRISVAGQESIHTSLQLFCAHGSHRC
jgi:hypothetical protein